MAVEKYDYRKWEKEQFDNRGRLQEHSCINRYSDLIYYKRYDGEDTYGTVLGFQGFCILVSQDGVKPIKINGTNLTIDVMQKVIETVCLIKESSNKFKFSAETALFWHDKPFTPNYIGPLWYFHSDKTPVKVEDVEEYIQKKQLELEKDGVT